MVSVLGDHEPYEFPEPVELELRLKDVLEDEVEEKFYLDEEKVNKLIINSDKLSIGYIPRTNGTQHQSNTIYKIDAESPSMQARDYKDPVKVLIKNATKKGYLEATHGDGVDLAYPESKTRRGRVQSGLSQTLDTGDSKGVVIGASRGRNPKNPSDRTVGTPTEQRLEINKQGTSNTITTVQKDNYVVEGMSDKFSFVKRKSREIIAEKGRLPKYYNPYNKSEIIDVAPTITTNSDRASNSGQVMINKNFRIRKLTPLECWRLMGFSDGDFYKAQSVNSNTQLYKQAGNSIVVNVLEGIFSQMFKEVKKEQN